MVAQTAKQPKERSRSRSTKSSIKKAAPRKTKKVKKVSVKPKTVSLRRVFSKQEKTKHLGTRPHSAWIFFCQDRRADIVHKNPNLGFGDICKTLASIWGEMTEADKAVYKKLAVQDIQRYERFRSNFSDTQKKYLRRYRKYRKERRKNHPKTALSPYMCFVKAKRAEIVKNQNKINPSTSFEDIGRLLGKTWKKLSHSEKLPFIELATEDRKRYARELANYRISIQR